MKKQKQSGAAHLMIITVILGLAVAGLLGYVFWQNFMQPKTSTESNVQSSQSKDDNKVVGAEKVSKLLPEIGLTIYLPKNYTINKGEEVNRFGSFAYYEFSNNLPSSDPSSSMSISSINLYSEKSVLEFNETVSSNPNNPLPPEGDYFGINDVPGILNAYKNCTDFQAKYVKYECLNLSNGKWLVATHVYTSRKSGYIREYVRTIETTGTIIGVNLSINGTGFDFNEADNVFEQFEIR